MDLTDADHPTRRRRGLLIVLSSPSGAGKSTISRMLLEADPNITMSISATTRPMRPGESDDVDYHFVDDAEFERLIEADEFAEWAHVFDHRYGSPKEPIKEALKDGRDMLFDIDWQGTQQLEYAFRDGPGPDLHPAAVDGGAGAPACTSAAPTAKKSSPAGCGARPARSAIGPNMIMS